MDFYVIIGILITLVLLGGGIFLSIIFYKNEKNSQLIKDQLFIWFNGDLLVKIALVWVVVLLLDTISKFEMKLHKITHPL